MRAVGQVSGEPPMTKMVEGILEPSKKHPEDSPNRGNHDPGELMLALPVHRIHLLLRSRMAAGSLSFRRADSALPSVFSLRVRERLPLHVGDRIRSAVAEG